MKDEHFYRGFTRNKSGQGPEQVSSLVLFIRDKETIQNIHHSIISLNSDHWSFIYTSLPIKPQHHQFLNQEDPGFNMYKECCPFTTSNAIKSWPELRIIIIIKKKTQVLEFACSKREEKKWNKKKKKRKKYIFNCVPQRNSHYILCNQEWISSFYA